MKKKAYLVLVVCVVGILLYGIHWRIYRYVPPMKNGEIKIGVITSTNADYSSDLVIYDEDLNVQRIKNMDKYACICGRGAIRNRNYFAAVSGLMGMGYANEFFSVDMETEKVSDYPMEDRNGVLEVAANREYAYTCTNLNAQSIVTQYRQEDKKKGFQIKYPVLFTWIAANDTYLFAAAKEDFNNMDKKYCKIYVFHAETLKLLHMIDLSMYGTPIFDGNHLITEDSLYVPLYYLPDKLRKDKVEKIENFQANQDGQQREVNRQKQEEIDEEKIMQEERKRELASQNNKVIKISLDNFSVLPIELGRKAPTRIEKRGDTLFVVHDDIRSSEAYLTVYNEKTGKQKNYVLGDLFNISIALSENSLYMVGVDNKVGYYFIYRYDLAEDDSLQINSVKLLEKDDRRGLRAPGGIFVYTKKE